MNPYLMRLQPYPFEKLAELRKDITPPADKPLISLSIGEPKHAPPQFVIDNLSNNLDKLASYPPTKGSIELRSSIADWLSHRYKLPQQTINADRNILPVTGTREALFAFAQCALDPTHSTKKTVLMPNPFYQIYEGATLLAGLEPEFYPLTKENNYLLDLGSIDVKTWANCQLIFICSPNNPTGSVMPLEDMQKLIVLAEKYDFIIASDECYSEIYFDESMPPPGLLEAASVMGNTEFKRCMVFHSLSKRSNLPGLRSGFVAGDAALIKAFLLYRTYHGCAMSPPTQLASIEAWNDEQHVRNNRQAYREKFAAVLEIFDGVLTVKQPDAGFYLWPELPISDEVFAQGLYQKYHIAVLPGSYLARTANQQNPGENHARIALVAPLEFCTSAAHNIVEFLATV